MHRKAIHNEMESYECNECEKKFILMWRLKKHQHIHSKTNAVKNCHYFNNQKECPFEQIGCMFKHEHSHQCKFQRNCRNLLCQFKHENLIDIFEKDSDNNTPDEKDKSRDITWCEVCEYNYDSEELEDHENDYHNTSFFQKCSQCNSKVNNDSQIIRHRKRHGS